MIKYYKITSYIVLAGLAAGSGPVTIAADPPQPTETQKVINIASVGPGRVVFQIAPAGRWLRFGFRDGKNLIRGGGIAVYGERKTDSGKQLVSLGNAARGKMRANTIAPREKVVHEGDRGGARYPQNRSDDDDDGLVDEDRLDGVDNDGDGKTDEDFAAIGDQMIVARYVAKTGISVHQEVYAWSLSHIDAMVASTITIHNRSDNTIEHARVAIIVEPQAGLALTSENPVTPRSGHPSTAMLWRGGETSLATVLFAKTGQWATGEFDSGRDITVIVNGLASVEAMEGDEATAPFITSGQPGAGRVAVALSPDLGQLVPGEEVTINVVLAAIGSRDRAARNLDYAYRTVVGDGRSAMIPPPLSITRRALWGTYAFRAPDDPASGAIVTMFDVRRNGVNPQQVKYVTGIDWRAATRVEQPDGSLRLEVSGTLPEEFETMDKVTLHGRTQDGELFDVTLTPSEGTGIVVPADRYFNQGGKLDETLLSNSPNPFRDATTVYYEVPSVIVDELGNTITNNGSVDASVKVYNVAGRLVSTLVENNLSPGRYDTAWTARDEAGIAVASGVYYVKLQLGKRYITKRLLQLK